MASSRIAALALVTAGLAFADDAPGWLKEQAAVALPAYPGATSSVILLHEENTVVENSGKLATTTRRAVRILARTGADLLFFDQYDVKGGRVRDFRAWMVSASGKVKSYGKNEILDVACVENDVYNECRRRMASGQRDAEAGAVFGYESTIEYETFSNQLLFRFQESSPVRVARFAVTVPPGWEVRSSQGNGAPPPETLAGGSYAWRMENLPAFEREPSSPDLAALTPWAGVNLVGPGSKRPVLSWTEAAGLLADLNQGMAQPNEAIAARARSLVAGANTELDKIRAIARFTQQLNYVSIQLNVSKGGGYQPHPAAQTFEKQYGDCKDKANLMRSLLEAVGIFAYPVAIYSGDRLHVNQDWPSLGAFNHAISAIRVGPETQAPAVLEHPRLGRLLFFDPTDPFVPAGYLPDHEQASLALVGARVGGDLVRTPAGHPAAADHARQVDAVLGDDGSVTGRFEERFTGEALGDALAAYHANSKTDFASGVARWVARSVPGATTNGIEIADREGEFVLRGRFSAARFALRPQPAMLVLKGPLLSEGELQFTAKTRQYPIELDADARNESVRIELPPGFRVDELPKAARIDSPFGKYTAAWNAEGGAVVFRSAYEIGAATAPASQYAALKGFLDAVARYGDSPVVLVK